VQLSVTECLLYRGESVAHYDAVKRQIRDADPGAQLFGHEFCGVVAECGPGVVDYQVGDRVYAPGKIHCGECPYCRSGYENYCPTPRRSATIARVRSRGVRPAPRRADPADPGGRLRRRGRHLQPLASSVLCVADAGSTPVTTCSSSAPASWGSSAPCSRSGSERERCTPRTFGTDRWNSPRPTVRSRSTRPRPIPSRRFARRLGTRS